MDHTDRDPVQIQNPCVVQLRVVDADVAIAAHRIRGRECRQVVDDACNVQIAGMQNAIGRGESFMYLWPERDESARHMSIRDQANAHRVVRDPF